MPKNILRAGTAIMGIAAASAMAAAPTPAEMKSALEWLKTPAAPVPGDVSGVTYANASEAEAGRNAVIKVYREYVKQQNWDKNLPPLANVEKKDMTPAKLSADGQEMPYVLVAKGKPGPKGWPLIIAMHGGGQDPNGRINNSEWGAQKQFFSTFYPDGMYFIPRMANDRDGRWWYDYCQKMYDQMIRSAIWTRNVDPDRIYVTGISEGGYAAFRMPCHTPDRYAAADAMAASEPMDTSPPENLHSVAFRCDIGEKDTMFGRDQLAKNYKAKLAELAKDNPGQYKHEVAIQPGRGHGIDYRPGPLWMIENTRISRPAKIAWTVNKMHNTFHPYHYWIALDKEPAAMPVTIQGEIKDNTVTLTAKDKQGNPVSGLPFRLYLDDKLVNLEKPVTVKVNGKEEFNGKVPLTMAAQLTSLSERSDPGYIFPAMIPLSF